ncbi:hypothetical protein GCM10010222_16100 [Streptomyces tanashiensis]|nr:hypothetical protein GCM10010222_16100 [Streptomyces tanashiensis]
MGDLVGQAVAAGHDPGFGAADPYLVGHARPGREHLRGDSDVEGFRAFEDEDGDAVET